MTGGLFTVSEYGRKHETPMYRVADDSAFLGIFDPCAYISYIGEEWEDDLVDHFKAEMYRYRLLLWGTGREGFWSVEVRREASAVTGFREFAGPIVATESLLCLTSYDSLAAGAMFQHFSLPEAHERGLCIAVTPGAYQCRIIQMQDPDECVETVADFVIELLPTDRPAAPWTTFPDEHLLE